MRTIRKSLYVLSLVVILIFAAGCTQKDDTAGITVLDTRYKTVYRIGETLNTENLKIEVLNAEQIPEVFDVTPDMVSGFNSSKIKINQKLTIRYAKDGKTKAAYYYIDVVPAAYKKLMSEKFSFYYPDNWLNNTVGGTQTFFDPESPDTNMNFIIFNQHDPNYKIYTAASFEQALSVSLKIQVKMDIFEKITFGGEKAIRMVFPHNGLKVIMEQIIVFRKSDTITFSFMRPQTDASTVFDDVKKMIYFF